MSRASLVFYLAVLVAAVALGVGLFVAKNWLLAWFAAIAFAAFAAVTVLVAGLAALLRSRRIAIFSARLAGGFAVLALTSAAMMFHGDWEEPPGAGSEEARAVTLVEAFRANHKGRAPCAAELGSLPTLPKNCVLHSCGDSMMQLVNGKWQDDVPIRGDEYMLTCRGMPSWIYSSKTKVWYAWED